jgi:transposase
MIGAIRIDAKPRLQMVEGAIDGKRFVHFVRRKLVPFIARGDVVVMDNLSVHKSTDARAAIEAVGASVLFLPTYSPEFNPIELWWADLKRRLRSRCAESLDALLIELRRIQAATARKSIAAWFRHCIENPHFN